MLYGTITSAALKFEMSSLPGEQALKDGLSFEFTWTARYLLELLEERAESIQLGGQASEHGVDFRLHCGTHDEHHQVKRAYGTQSEWTIAALDREGVLQDFKERLADPRVRCHFVSTLPAVSLKYLSIRARDSSDYVTFLSSWLGGKYQTWFDDLVKRWALPAEECWNRLRRVEARHPDDLEIELSSLSMLRPMVVGDPKEAWAHLRDFCFHHVHQIVRSADLWRWLAGRGVERQIIFEDDRVIACIEAQTQRYLVGVRRKLIKPPFRRAIADSILATLAGSRHGKDVVVLGTPGGGKSALMLQIVDACEGRGWPVLAFRLDELPASLMPTELKRELELPVAPARAIALAAAGKPAVVVIDQLDAVSHYSGRTGNLFDRVDELIRELRGHRLRSPIHLVIACRDVDWRHDGRFRQLRSPTVLSGAENEDIYTVDRLTDEEISTILTTSGFDTAEFSPKQREQLLRYPQYLAILIDTHPSPEIMGRIVTPKQLFDAYWDKKQRDASIRFASFPGNPWSKVLAKITSKLSETALALSPSSNAGSADGDAPLAVSKRQLEAFSPTLIDWMISSGVLTEGAGRIRFGHESFFDYCFARFFEQRDETLLEYLLRSDQTLIQRGQVRQVLAYQRDEGKEIYLGTASTLLESERIRPHLKQLVIVVLCDVVDPTPEECDFLKPYLDNALSDFDAALNTTLACQIFYAFAASLPLFRMVCENGTFATWITASKGQSRDRLFRILLRHQETAQQEVWQQIAPLVGDVRYEADLDGLSHFCKASQSRETFEWLIEAMRAGIHRDDKNEHRWDRFYSLGEDLAKNQPGWFAEWVAALMRARLVLGESGGWELLKEHSVQPQSITLAEQEDPVQFVEQVLPALIEVLESKGKGESHGWSHVHVSDDDDCSHYLSLDEHLLNALVDALRTSIQKGNPQFQGWMESLRQSSSKTCRRLHAVVLCGEAPELTSMTAHLLTERDAVFQISGLRGDNAACLMLRNHADRFDPKTLSDIETAILRWYPSRENRPTKEFWNPVGATCLGNYRGHQQMMLLRAMPPKALSLEAQQRLKELERKFDSVDRFDFAQAKSRPINFDALNDWSPGRFLSAISKRRFRSRRPWRQDGFLWDGEINTGISTAIKSGPVAFAVFLQDCDSRTDTGFIRTVADQLCQADLPPSIIKGVIFDLHRLGEGWEHQIVRMLGKLPKEDLVDWEFDLLMNYATLLPGPDLQKCQHDKNDLAKHLHHMAINSVRGQALGVLKFKLWDEPEMVDLIKDRLPEMMRDSNSAIRSEVASLCYAIASTNQCRAFAIELFVILASDHLPDEHVLASHWPFEFMRVSLGEYWTQLRPIIENMLASASSEVRAAGARLACIAAAVGKPALDLAELCAVSADPNVRLACARVVAYHVGSETKIPWISKTFLRLADDLDVDVRRATCSVFSRSRALDFGLFDKLLTPFLKTRAFVTQPMELIRSVSESPAMLPMTVFEVVQALVDRVSEPSHSNSDRLHYHVNQASEVIKRLYHENRDNSLRRKALDMIDALCVHGGLTPDKIDQ